GPGAQPGTVPTDVDQATGLERLELLAKLEGREFFDLSPLKMDRLGTKQDPIIITSTSGERQVGCTGHGIESHETLWLNVTHKHEFDRCPECGSVF
ncbi:cytochrome c oxidase, partial [Thamnocephalis sphaerospora]